MGRKGKGDKGKCRRAKYVASLEPPTLAKELVRVGGMEIENGMRDYAAMALGVRRPCGDVRKSVCDGGAAPFSFFVFRFSFH